MNPETFTEIHVRNVKPLSISTDNKNIQQETITRLGYVNYRYNLIITKQFAHQETSCWHRKARTDPPSQEWDKYRQSIVSNPSSVILPPALDGFTELYTNLTGHWPSLGSTASSFAVASIRVIFVSLVIDTSERRGFKKEKEKRDLIQKESLGYVLWNSGVTFRVKNGWHCVSYFGLLLWNDIMQILFCLFFVLF